MMDCIIGCDEPFTLDRFTNKLSEAKDSGILEANKLSENFLLFDKQIYFMLSTIKNMGLAGAVFLLTAIPGVVAAQAPPACSTPWDCGKNNAAGVGLPGGAIYQIISQALSWMMAILGFIAIIGFVISGLLYLTAAGNDGQAEQAKNAMKYSIIGVIVALVGYVAVKAVDALLSGTSNAF